MIVVPSCQIPTNVAGVTWRMYLLLGATRLFLKPEDYQGTGLMLDFIYEST